MNPKVSVVMPAYNRSDFIEASINSVINQDYKNWELIIVDDKSTDDTLSKIQTKATSDNRIIGIANTLNSGGAALPRNKAIDYATGEYVAFLDSDDVWHPQKLSFQISKMIELKIDFSATARKDFQDDKEILFQKSINGSHKKLTYKQLIRKNILNTSSVIIKKELLARSPFSIDDNYKCIEDYQLWLNILKKCEYVFVFNEKLLFYRKGHNSLSQSKIKMLGKVYQVLCTETDNVFYRFYYLLTYIALSIYYIIVRR
jgi:teichuronic acid biosynthesis glycosyltransferase TuaG